MLAAILLRIYISSPSCRTPNLLSVFLQSPVLFSRTNSLTIVPLFGWQACLKKMESDAEPDLEKSAPADRIRWRDQQVARQGRPSLYRTHSAGSMSIRSVRSRHVDPNIALPIQYRTVSFNIEESRAKDAVGLAKAKDKTTKGF